MGLKMIFIYYRISLYQLNFVLWIYQQDGMGIGHTNWSSMGIPEREVGCKITLTSISFTTPRRGSAFSMLSLCTAYSLDNDWGKRLGSGSRQSRDLPVDGRKLVIRQPIKKNNKKTGGPLKIFFMLLQQANCTLQ